MHRDIESKAVVDSFAESIKLASLRQQAIVDLIDRAARLASVGCALATACWVEDAGLLATSREVLHASLVTLSPMMTPTTKTTSQFGFMSLNRLFRWISAGR